MMTTTATTIEVDRARLAHVPSRARDGSPGNNTPSGTSLPVPGHAGSSAPRPAVALSLLPMIGVETQLLLP